MINTGGKRYKVALTKIKSNHSVLRTDIVEGATEELPEKGKVFQLIGNGLKFGNRIVTTSEVQFVEKQNDEYRFNTLNSTYNLRIIES